MNMIAERTKKDDRKFELVKNPGELIRDLNTYFPKLMNYLWEQPKIVSFIIQNSGNEELREHLAPFFANNFYENILSSYFIEDNLMYVLTLLLEEEINNLNDVNQYENFLDNTPCGCLLKELRKKKDIQSFFKTIIFNSVENLEVNHSSSSINFKIKEKNNELKKNDSIKKNKNKKKSEDEEYLKFRTKDLNSSLENINNIRNKQKEDKEKEIFTEKYTPLLDKKALQTLLNENKDNIKMKNFLNKNLNDCNSNENLYSNSILLNNLYKSDDGLVLLSKYQKSFMIVINFINKIIENMLNNIQLLPYSVKCICKIISLLIQKKFPSISELEKNAFISKFFFANLLEPILKNPEVEAFINDFIITQNTLNNLSIISDIINKFSSGTLYKSINKESDYTPFNWYFIGKMNNLFDIFENATKAILPPFIQKLINGDLPSDFEYDYFKENPDEVICHRSMFFNLEQVKHLLNIMNNNKSKIFTSNKTKGLEKTVEKLLNSANQTIFNEILLSETIKKEESIKKSKKKDNKIENTKESETKLHYFLITSLKYNERYNQLFSIEQNTPNFSIKEIKKTDDKESKNANNINEKKKTDDEETINANNIIKVKNFFCSLLYNYNKLVKTDFEIGKIENTNKILTELKIFMKSSNFVVDGTIPSEWYVTSLLEYLTKIPEKLTKNDCEELYKEIINDVNKSIKELDFEALSVIMGKLKFAKRGKIYFEESKKLLIDIKLNQKSKTIIENNEIPIDLIFSLDDENEKNSIFRISPSNLKFKEKEKNKIEKIHDYVKKQKKNLSFCLTIEEFTKKFPNLVEYQDKQDIDILQIQQDLNFPIEINKYMELIRENLKKEYEEGLESILEKIYDYIMLKIYDKIFPIEPYLEDTKIFQQSIILSWTEPKHFIKRKRELVLGSFLTDVLKYFKLIDAEKSPRKKILNMKHLFNSIGFLLQFNGEGKDIGVDDLMPILNYAFIKGVKNTRIYSNTKFMELYIGEGKSRIEGSELTQLKGTCEFIIKLKCEQLFDVTPEEFNLKCSQASTMDIPY